ncbi:hypothetical protein GBA63_22470 (plasmid) [Rubrobacter tropicus]|uniref:Uncharacterized protein n=1 Tax=Rubrobacter tropicus TaxID=2653851 RepID=A0A6G8QG45_9ACTN|nr:hypothetical protein [Rubrobacter tropicus]QIN85469.1 hypothetical protein GBA63_22470 [Rubrobacter tropicus]
MSDPRNPFWDDLPIIDAYTREDAIDDGVLVDVSGLAGEAGCTSPARPAAPSPWPSPTAYTPT